MEKMLREIGSPSQKKTNGEADPNSQCHEWKMRCTQDPVDIKEVGRSYFKLLKELNL